MEIVTDLLNWLSGLGIPPLATVVIAALLVGVVLFWIGAASEAPGLGTSGCMMILLTVILGICWFFWGPFYYAWILAPTLIFGVISILTEFSDEKPAGVGCGGVLLITAGGIISWGVYELHPPTPTSGPVQVIRVPVHELGQRFLFCQGEDLRIDDAGYLITPNYIPVRAIARTPNAPMFATQKMEYPKDVAGTMRPWYPYYVFGRDETTGVLVVGEGQRTPETDRRWLNEDNSFCWTTRQTFNIEEPIDIYPSLEDAQAATNPVARAYLYRYSDHFVSGESKGMEFELASLPVLSQNDGIYWSFVRPDPEGHHSGYQICWLKWDGQDPSITFRIRASRREIDAYLAGILALLEEWRISPARTDARKRLYDHGQAHMTRGGQLGIGKFDQIQARRQGIPRLTGFMAEEIESPLQAEEMKKNALNLLRISGSEGYWDANEVAFIKLQELP